VCAEFSVALCACFLARLCTSSSHHHHHHTHSPLSFAVAPAPFSACSPPGAFPPPPPFSQVRAESRAYLHALCAKTEPGAATHLTAFGAVHPHVFLVTLLLEELVVPAKGSAAGAPARASQLGETAESYELASELLAESCAGRCGGSASAFQAVLRALLQFITTSPIVETKAVGGAVDRQLAGSMELASVLVGVRVCFWGGGWMGLGRVNWAVGLRMGEGLGAACCAGGGEVFPVIPARAAVHLRPAAGLPRVPRVHSRTCSPGWPRARLFACNLVPRQLSQPGVSARELLQVTDDAIADVARCGVGPCQALHCQWALTRCFTMLVCAPLSPRRVHVLFPVCVCCLCLCVEA
jgi:hypothetical protein